METMVRITKDMVEKRLGDVPESFVFRCWDGRSLRNLRELQGALAEMENEIYVHHVTEQKNDFSRWVSDVIGDDKLATDLEKSAGKSQAAKAVSSRITFLEGKSV
jgi:hypothetical protein